MYIYTNIQRSIRIKIIDAVYNTIIQHKILPFENISTGLPFQGQFLNCHAGPCTKTATTLSLESIKRADYKNCINPVKANQIKCWLFWSITSRLERVWGDYQWHGMAQLAPLTFFSGSRLHCLVWCPAPSSRPCSQICSRKLQKTLNTCTNKYSDNNVSI